MQFVTIRFPLYLDKNGMDTCSSKAGRCQFLGSIRLGTQEVCLANLDDLNRRDSVSFGKEMGSLIPSKDCILRRKDEK